MLLKLKKMRPEARQEVLYQNNHKLPRCIVNRKVKQRNSEIKLIEAGC